MLPGSDRYAQRMILLVGHLLWVMVNENHLFSTASPAHFLPTTRVTCLGAAAILQVVGPESLLLAPRDNESAGETQLGHSLVGNTKQTPVDRKSSFPTGGWI